MPIFESKIMKGTKRTKVRTRLKIGNKSRDKPSKYDMAKDFNEKKQT